MEAKKSIFRDATQRVSGPDDLIALCDELMVMLSGVKSTIDCKHESCGHREFTEMSRETLLHMAERIIEIVEPPA